MSERLLFPCFVFFLCLSCLYVLSHFYLFSVLNFNSHDVENAQHQTQSAPADNFGYSETSAAIFQDESGDIDTEPSFSCDAEVDDEIIGKAQSSPLFIQEREEPADRRQAYHSPDEGLSSAQSFFAHTSTGRPVYEPNSDVSQKRKSNRDLENERIRFSLFLLKSDLRSRSTNFKPILKEEVSRLTGIIQRREIDHTITSDEQSRRDQLLLPRTTIRTKIGIFVKLVSKSLHVMEELKRVQELRIDEFSRRILIENQDTIYELTARIQEIQNEVN